jgi:CheY-like chemotaxis protein
VVLYVEDNDDVRELIVMLLGDGLTVVSCGSAEARSGRFAQRHFEVADHRCRLRASMTSTGVGHRFAAQQGDLWIVF